MHATTIVGYTFDAENHHPTCLMPGARADRVEPLLNRMASTRGIDRTDESTFDSDDFPKVILADQVTDDDTCDRCHDPLI